MVRMTNARRPRIRPRSSLTPTAPMPLAEVPERRATGPATTARRPGVGSAESAVLGRLGRDRSSVIVVPYAASTGSRSADVTWRKSSSRSLAARAKLTIGRPLATDAASRRADAASSPRNPSSIVPSGRIDRRWPRRDRRRTNLGPPPAPRPRAGAGPAGRPRSAAASRCRRRGPGPGPGRGRRSRRSCTAPRARAGCGC